MKLDKTERFFIISFLILMMLDFISTAMFVMKGYGNMEANFFIHRYGWFVGLGFVLIANILYIIIMLYFLRLYKNKITNRYFMTSCISTFIIVRSLVVINNAMMLLRPTVASNTVQKIPPSYVLYFAIFVIAVLGGMMLSNIFTFWIFKKNYKMRYVR